MYLSCFLLDIDIGKRFPNFIFLFKVLEAVPEAKENNVHLD